MLSFLQYKKNSGQVYWTWKFSHPLREIVFCITRKTNHIWEQLTDMSKTLSTHQNGNTNDILQQIYRIQSTNLPITDSSTTSRDRTQLKKVWKFLFPQSLSTAIFGKWSKFSSIYVRSLIIGKSPPPVCILKKTNNISHFAHYDVIKTQC